jgi:uncharacterized membrane protein YbhN (UPF0104 family)
MSFMSLECVNNMFLMSTVDPGAAISVAIGLILGAGGSLWFINRAMIENDEPSDPTVKKRIRRALFNGTAVASPTDADLAVRIAASRRKALRAIRGTLIGYLALATVALIIAVVGGSSLLIVMAALIMALAITAGVTSLILGKRLGKAELANKQLLHQRSGT